MTSNSRSTHRSRCTPHVSATIKHGAYDPNPDSHDALFVGADLRAFEDATCKHRDCFLPVYAEGLCEPCWEIGRDELDIEVELEENER